MYSDHTAGTSTQGTVEGFAKNELVGYFGKTAINSLESKSAAAEAFEYRRQLGWEFTRVSIGLVNEGDSDLIRRTGITYEGWLEPSFWDGNASVGVGWAGTRRLISTSLHRAGTFPMWYQPPSARAF
jgi:hypothetical protein